MNFLTITRTYLKLSILSIGGPVSHIALLFDTFVTQKQVLSSAHFTQLFSISQSLPGPASTQLAYAIALVSSGPILAVWSFICWSLFGFVIMTGAGIGVSLISNLPSYALYIQSGLTSSAVGLITISGFKLTNQIVKTKTNILLCCFSTCIAIYWSFPWLYPVLMIFGAFIGFLDYRLYFSSNNEESSVLLHEDLEPTVSFYSWKSSLVVFLVLVGLFIVSIITRESFFKSNLDLLNH